MRRRDFYIIWPVYFDRKKTRREGRKLPSRLTVETPTIQEIFQAAKKLGLNPVIEEDKAHPSAWFEYKGRLLIRKVEWKGNKNSLLKELAKILREMRKH